MRGLLWWMIAVPLSPVMLPLAVYALNTTLRLPVASGPREGVVGVERTGRALRLLVLGESTAVGVGVEQLEDGLAAQLARCLSERFERTVCWRTCGESGIRLGGALERLLPGVRHEEPADIVLLVLGVNDTMGLCGKRRWQEGLARLIDGCAGGGARVVLTGVPPIQHFCALPWLLRRVFGWRASLLDRWARQVAERKGALHLPVRLRFEPRFLARDGYHPSSAGYRYWAQSLADQYPASLDSRQAVDSSPENEKAGISAGPEVRP